MSESIYFSDEEASKRGANWSSASSRTSMTVPDDWSSSRRSASSTTASRTANPGTWGSRTSIYPFSPRRSRASSQGDERLLGRRAARARAQGRGKGDIESARLVEEHQNWACESDIPNFYETTEIWFRNRHLDGVSVVKAYYTYRTRWTTIIMPAKHSWRAGETDYTQQPVPVDRPKLPYEILWGCSGRRSWCAPWSATISTRTIFRPAPGRSTTRPDTTPA